MNKSGSIIIGSGILVIIILLLVVSHLPRSMPPLSGGVETGNSDSSSVSTLLFNKNTTVDVIGTLSDSKLSAEVSLVLKTDRVIQKQLRSILISEAVSDSVVSHLVADSTVPIDVQVLLETNEVATLSPTLSSILMSDTIIQKQIKEQLLLNKTLNLTAAALLSDTNVVVGSSAILTESNDSVLLSDIIKNDTLLQDEVRSILLAGAGPDSLVAVLKEDPKAPLDIQLLLKSSDDDSAVAQILSNPIVARQLKQSIVSAAIITDSIKLEAAPIAETKRGVRQSSVTTADSNTVKSRNGKVTSNDKESMPLESDTLKPLLGTDNELSTTSSSTATSKETQTRSSAPSKPTSSGNVSEGGNTASKGKTSSKSSPQSSKSLKSTNTDSPKEQTVAQKYAALSQKKTADTQEDEEWDPNATFEEYRGHIDTTRARGVLFPMSYTHKLDTLADGSYSIIIARRAFDGFSRIVREKSGVIRSKKNIRGTDSMTVKATWK